MTAKITLAVIAAIALVVIVVTLAIAPWRGDSGESVGESSVAQSNGGSGSDAAATGTAASNNKATVAQSQDTGSVSGSTSSSSSNVQASGGSSQGQSAQSSDSGSGNSGGGTSGTGGSGSPDNPNQGGTLGSSGTDFAGYDFYEGTQTDDYGRVVLTEAAAGKQLKDGVTYVVTSNVTLAPSGYYAGLVANNNLIYVEKGATLTVKGADGIAVNPGLPGVALPSDRSLCVSGEGTLVCTGGNAGDGGAGSNGGNGSYNDDAGSHGEYYSGAGGNGGAGGGGAGAGIGTAGGFGGSAGAGGRSVTGVQWTSSDDEANGNYGTLGGTGGYPASTGCLCVAGSVKLLLSGGKVGKGGAGGNAGSSDIAFHWYKYIAGAGGGGGGGGGGGAGNAYGQGGSGGNGGGGGGSGGCVYRRRGVSDDAPTGGGGTYGCMGGAAQLMTVAGSNGTSGAGVKTSVTDVSGGDGASWSFPSSAPRIDYKNKLLVTYSEKSNIVGTQCDGTTVLSGCLTTVISYTGFSTVANNNGWYVANTLCDPGNPNWIVTFQSVIGEATADNLGSVLSGTVPPLNGRTFLGWELVKSDGTTVKIYDAQTRSFNFALLSLEKVTSPGLTADKCVWMTGRNITVRAVWADFTYSIRYHSNKSKFIDPQTQQEVAVDECVVSGLPAGVAVQLWNNADRGTYHVSAPSDAANKKLVWATAIDSEGEPFIEMFDVDEPFKPKVKDETTVIDLYACWVDKGSTQLQDAGAEEDLGVQIETNEQTTGSTD